jgi:inosine-uridine nucleoside N-ribohydrolase
MKAKHPLAIIGLVVACLQIWMVGAFAQPTPVIFDTDIGDDIDDTWALVMLLKSPELDLRLVTTTRGKAEYRAKLVARILTIAGRTDIPISLGAGGRTGDGGQKAWVQDYKLQSYPGKVYEDGVNAILELVHNSTRPVTIISVGPSHTLAAVLERQPDIAPKAYFVGMQGSVRKGYDGGPVCAEYNVKENIPAAQSALLARWKKTTITPLDTCGLVKLSGPRFETLVKSSDPLIKALLDNYRIWAKKDNLTQSSILFDTVAVYLAYPGAKPLLELEELKINVNSAGFTTIDPNGTGMTVATAWKNLDGYEDWMMNLLTSDAQGKRPGRN